MFGDDDLPDESVRIGSGLILPIQMTVGSSATLNASAYSFGTNVGTITYTFQLLGQGPLTVAAGTFSDVLHVRWTMSGGSGSQVKDEWWAKAVGLVKKQGISGNGAALNFELTQYSVPPSPTLLASHAVPQLSPQPDIHVSDGNLNFSTGQFGFSIGGQQEQIVVVEGSTDLVNWQPLQTNIFQGSITYFNDPQWTNYPCRFYRVRTP
jgi:hypothetical protein